MIAVDGKIYYFKHFLAYELLFRLDNNVPGWYYGGGWPSEVIILCFFSSWLRSWKTTVHVQQFCYIPVKSSKYEFLQSGQ